MGVSARSSVKGQGRKRGVPLWGETKDAREAFLGGQCNEIGRIGEREGIGRCRRTEAGREEPSGLPSMDQGRKAREIIGGLAQRGAYGESVGEGGANVDPVF